MDSSRTKAVLGPTNTGKTHLAIERLLAHNSGMIGFPLRLLARENYDRMVALKGARHVALITGEEKIVPPTAKWFSCTVEAMPLDRQVEFLAVDEIQLCADPDRGHVFTDRLLNARGLVETMFLGAETIRPLRTRLVPRIEIETRPRLSQLTYTGPIKLTRLPPRTAVVAFSAGEVYAIAELIRRKRGGCAVVMGRLSPRTRNAQVALYQNKEVDFLVATDAIGMGLNMDVDHVAFAALSKFDGHQPRRLMPAELAQIAGRAGRGMRDGTFGVTTDCPTIDDDIVAAMEEHSFEPLRELCWRNSDLDFSSIDALLTSLAAPVPMMGLTKGHDAADHITLEALSRDADVRRLADSRARVQLLWDVCQVPDFRKLADDSHVAFCRRIFMHLAQGETLSTDWIDTSLEQLNRTDGDIDTLMARLAGVRSWAYVTARADWVKNAETWQERTRTVEDALSDALHESLTLRFVDRRAAELMRKLDDADAAEELMSAVTRKGDVVVEGHPVGQVHGFQFTPDPEAAGDEKKMVLRAARRALREEIPRRLNRLEAATDKEFALSPKHRLLWDGAEIARLKTGAAAHKPQVEVIDTEFLDSVSRERVRVRAQRYMDELVQRELGPLFTAAEKADADATLRGPLHRLTESLGLIPGATDAEIDTKLRAALKAVGTRAGRFAFFIPALMKPRAQALRAQLWALARGENVPELPAGGLVAIPPPASWPQGFAAAMGWLEAGPVLLRQDVAERIAGELGHATRKAPMLLPVDLASRLSVKGDALEPVLHTLGFRIIPTGVESETVYGPPAPAMVGVLRRRVEGESRPHRKPQHSKPPRKAPDQATAPAAADATADTRPPRPPRPPKGDGFKGKKKFGGDKRRDGKPSGETIYRAAPKPAADKPFDPDSPFAVLAALRKTS